MFQWAMAYNFHPPLVSFPFALISVVVILELILLFYRSEIIAKAITVNLIFIVLTVVAAFFSGYQAMELANVKSDFLQDLVAYHHNMGRLLLFSTLACFVMYLAAQKASKRKILFSLTYKLLLLLCFTLVIFTGYLGADLVFSHGIGVAQN